MLEAVKAYAKDHQVPIICEDGLLFLSQVIKGYKVKDILEIGTGTGVFPVVLRVLVPEQSLMITATDISGDALTVAELNASLNNVDPTSINFLKRDGLKDIFGIAHRQDIVFSNPPFSTSNRVGIVNAGGIHPTVALDGGQDGTHYYQRFLIEARRVLKPDGVTIFQLPLQKDDLWRTVYAIQRIAHERVFLMEDCIARYRKNGPQFIVIGNNFLISELSNQGYKISEI